MIDRHGILNNLKKIKVGVRKIDTNNENNIIYYARSIDRSNIYCKYLQENDGTYTAYDGFIGGKISLVDLNILFFIMKLRTLSTKYGGYVYVKDFIKKIEFKFISINTYINLYDSNDILPPLRIVIRSRGDTLCANIYNPDKDFMDCNYDDICLALNEFDRYEGKRNLLNRIFTKSKFKFISD